MKTIDWNPKFLIHILTIQMVVVLVTVLDIPFARQVLVSLYLLIIPGLAILKAFKIKTSNMTETILFSIGLSIVFVIVVGLIINQTNIMQPLSITPILIAFSILVPLISLLGCLRKKENFDFSFPKDIKLTHVMVYIAIPLISVVAVMLVKVYGINFLPALIVIILSVLFVLALFSKIPAPHYPFVLVSMAAALLLMTYLTSNYINGFDVHYEYVLFKETQNTSFWNPYFASDPSQPLVFHFYAANAMLGSTVFPTIFSNMASIEGPWIFNILFPLIFSLVPLVLYQLFQKQFDKKIAFLSVLFFISNNVFFDFRNNERQMIAELFFLLIFLVFFNKDMEKNHKWVFLASFGFGLIVTYYSLNYLFLFFILTTWLYAKIFGRNETRKITLEAIFFLAVTTFLWYLYIARGAFDRFTLALAKTAEIAISEFFLFQSRGQMVEQAFILTTSSFLHQIGRLLYYFSVFLIMVGLVTLLVKRKKRICSEFSGLIYANAFILLLAIIVPNFAEEIQINKLYNISLLFLSPLFVLGGIALFKNVVRIFGLKKERRERYGLALIVTVLVPFFLFQTGFVYEVAGIPGDTPSIALSGYRMDDLTRLVNNLIYENDFFGGSWLSKYTSVSDRTVYSDTYAMDNVLFISLMDSNFTTQRLSNETTITETPSYVFLNRYNVNSGNLLSGRYPNVTYHNISDISILNTSNINNNKIYANGDCEIHYYGNK